MKHILTAALCVLLFPNDATASASTGSQFLSMCKAALAPLSGSESAEYIVKWAMDTGFCAGYVEGYTVALQKSGKGVSTAACFPENLNNDQALRVLIEFLENNPAELHRGVGSSAQRAFSRAFPCSKG